MALPKSAFTEKQIEIIRFDNQHSPWLTICEGAVRSGKSIVNAWLFWAHTMAYRNRGVKFIITGNTLSSIRRNVLDDLASMFGVDTQLNQSNMFKMNGNYVYIFGADDSKAEQKLRGFTAYGWLANEVTTQHENLVKQAFARCSGTGARIFWDTNPDNPMHFIKTEYIDKSGMLDSVGRTMIKSWHFTLEDNTFLDKQYVENFKATQSGVFYYRNVLGLWVSAEGMIYSDFNIDECTVERAPDGLRYFGSIDWGFTPNHYTVVMVHGEDSSGNVYLVDEWAKWETDIDEIVETKKKLESKYGYMRWYCDPARQEYIRKVNGKNAVNDVVPGIMTLATLIKQKKYKIVSGAGKKFLSEIWAYRWNDNSRKDEPVKENDDAMDCARYAVHSYLNRNKNTIQPVSWFNV